MLALTLSRSQITNAFSRLAEKLKVRGVIGDIYVFGGAALVMAYDAEPATRDVDAVFRPHGIVHDEAVTIAAELRIPRWWLNDQTSTFLPTTDDTERVGLFEKFDLATHVDRLDRSNLLYLVVSRFCEIDLLPLPSPTWRWAISTRS